MNNSFFRQALFLGVLIAIGIVLFRQLYFFVGAFLGAVTLYVVLRRTMFRMTEELRCHRWLASLILVTVAALCLGGLGWLLVSTVGSELTGLDFNAAVRSLDGLLDRVNEALGLHIIPQDILNRSDGVMRKVANGVLNTTYSFTTNIFMMLLILYFMLAQGRKMEKRFMDYVPFKDASLGMIKRETKTMIYSNAVGMPVILALQTLVSTLIYWLLGFGDPWFWGFLTALCGLVPVVGTMLIYLPVAVWLAATGEMWNGIILAVYGMVVISNADNVFRIVLLRKVADTHPLVVIFGVLLGLPLFGFWGIIFGPLFISVFMLLIKIYYREYGLLQDEPAATEPEVRKNVPAHFKKIHERVSKR